MPGSLICENFSYAAWLKNFFVEELASIQSLDRSRIDRYDCSRGESAAHHFIPGRPDSDFSGDSVNLCVCPLGSRSYSSLANTLLQLNGDLI